MSATEEAKPAAEPAAPAAEGATETTTTTTTAATTGAVTTKKVVIAYYSRTDTTKIVAEALAEKLKEKGEDPELLRVIVDKSNEGYLYNGFLAARSKAVDIKDETMKLGKEATEVWLCGPVHCWTLCAALRKFIEVNQEALKSEQVTISSIATMGGSGDDSFFKAIEQLLAKKISKKVGFKSSLVKDAKQFPAALDAFINPKAPEEPKAEEPKAEEPKAEEPKAEEPKAESQ